MTSDPLSKQLGMLVTGATGFVGSSLCEMIAERGWRVVAASRRPAGSRSTPGITDTNLPFLSHENEWQSALTSVHCVVHLAALAHQMGSAGKDAAAFHTANVDGSRFVAVQAARAGVRRFVFLSSIKVNGEGGSREPYRAQDVPNPSDAYARSKLEAEQILRDICRRAGMELVIIRPPLIYGPGVRANFQRLLRLAELGLPLPLRSIDNRRSLVSIWNLTDFIEKCATHPDAAGETWLISDGEDLSTPELFRKLALLMRKPARLFSLPHSWLLRVGTILGMRAEVDRLCGSLLVDAAPAFQRLNWRPPMSVERGLSLTVDAYRANRRQ